MKLVAGWLTFLALLYAGVPAHADTLYLDEAAFLAAAGPVTMESFEALGVSSTDVFGVDAGAFAISTRWDSLRVRNTGVLGSHATDGTLFVHFDGVFDLFDPLGRLIPSRLVRFTFDLPINRFGVTLSDALDGGTFVVTIGLTTNGGASFPSALSGVQTDGSESFLGLIADNSFTQLLLTWNRVPRAGIDEVLYANVVPTAVPEPGSLFLFGSGVLAAAAKARGRQRLMKVR